MTVLPRENSSGKTRTARVGLSLTFGITVLDDDANERESTKSESLLVLPTLLFSIITTFRARLNSWNSKFKQSRRKNERIALFQISSGCTNVDLETKVRRKRRIINRSRGEYGYMV